MSKWDARRRYSHTAGSTVFTPKLTSCMNLRQTGRISLLRVALNIMTCFSWGVALKISWTSRLMSTTRSKHSNKSRRLVFLHPVSRSAPSLTQLFQHFVALVQHKVFDVLQLEDLAVDQRQGATGCSHHNVRTVLLQHLLVLLNGHAAEEHRHLDARHVLGEALVLFADLKGQFSGVAHDKDWHLEENKCIEVAVLKMKRIFIFIRFFFYSAKIKKTNKFYK